MKSDNIAKTELLEQVKKLAGEYYRLTGKPLGVTGEVGEYEAARILGLDLAEARTAGYDATDISRNKRRALDVPKVKQIGRVKWGRGE